jgi:RNA polymerase sigma-70 factor (ECF subfamily)
VDERRAIARLKRGDIGGLETLVRAYQVRAVRSAYLITRDTALAEDVVQSAFIRVWERIEQFDDTRPFSPWFMRIVANDATKAVTRTRRFAPLDPMTRDGDEREGGPPVWLADGADGPDALLERAETREEVWQALGKLSPVQREAVVLRYFLELGEAEVAGRQGVATGTVKWRLHAARERLGGVLSGLRTERGASGALEHIDQSAASHPKTKGTGT